MGCLSVKTLCKGIAILFFVNFQGLNVQSNETTAPPPFTSSSATESQTSAHSTLLVTTSSSSTQTSPQTPVTTPPASTSSSATESQTAAHSTLLVTTNSSSTQTSPQTPVTTPPASTSSSATESQTAANSTPPASTSSSTSAHSKPDVIRNLKVTNITTSSVFLRWDEQTENIPFFKITWTVDDINENRTSSTFFCDITGLTAGVNYTFCVTAVIKDNERESEPSCISTYTEPDVIRNLTVTNISTSSVFLTWQEPVGNRSFFKLNWAGDKTIGNASEITNTSYNITDLIAGVNYTFCITAVAADNSTEGGAICISQYTKPDVIRNLTVSEVTTSSVFLTWDEPIGNRSFFKLQWTDVETNRNYTTSSNTSHLITDLISGVKYTFCITAVAADNSTKGETFCISQYTKPDVIRNLTVSNVTTSSVLLTWQEPNGKRSFFKVKMNEDKPNGNAIETTKPSHHITNLTAGVNYTFCVTVVTADNIKESEPFCISKYTVPNMIRNLTVTNITTSSVILTWQEPVGNRSFFKLLWTGDKTIENASEITDTSHHITNLTAGVNYTFCVTAVTADNLGESEPFCISKYTGR
ncbi:receptor-type tyrosine-protein phosphatase eta-like [Chanodichthys erythropterus]|uniref:receptor-type tyrosine-protein phosphatase eta-like n=1 Tax=Chanodichthys erythropterus TaxID=933992 RepID=UPI00351ED686